MTTPIVGVVGGGQLARMMQQAAIGMGLPLRLLAEGPEVSAAQVIPDHRVGDYRDLDTLRKVLDGCTVVTFDHEHVPTEHLHALDAEGLACRPGPHALVCAQDKSIMRRRLGDIGVPAPLHRLVETEADVDDFAAEVGGYPLMLKTTRGGYDGKGVWTVSSAPEAAPLLRRDIPVMAEERVDFARELAVLVARAPSGQCAVYPVVESVQRDGICVEVVAPAPGLSAALSDEAQEIGLRIAGALDVTGVLAVEMFETREGSVLVNELAMRPHNTGHWSIDGAVTSQFENHLRAVLDLPLGSPQARQPWTVMVNVLGGAVGRLHDGFPHLFARDPGLRVHVYGKEVRPGRKVGHVTAYGSDLDDVTERARHAARWLQGDLPDEQSDDQ